MYKNLLFLFVYYYFHNDIAHVLDRGRASALIFHSAMERNEPIKPMDSSKIKA